MKKSITLKMVNIKQQKILRYKWQGSEKDMLQKVLVEAVGASRQTINAVEKGKYNPTIKLCRKICRMGSI